MAAPLTNLTKKGAFAWSKTVQQSFDHFNRLMSTCPMLAIPNFSKPFELKCDTSGEGIGVVLIQNKHPIASESKKLRGGERAYSIYDKEIVGDHACFS